MVVLEHHYGDPYQNSYSMGRINYYGITGYPTAKFDGVLLVLGAQPCPPPFATYDEYLPMYNQRMAVSSPFLLDIASLTAMGNNEFQVNIHIEKVDPVALQNLKLHVFVTETDIPEIWQCLEEVNYVTRLMVPGVNGTDLDFSGSNEVTVPLYFSINQAWDFDNLELVALVQENNTTEIFQAIKVPIPEHNLDAELTDLTNVPAGNCSGTIQPSFLLSNQGGTAITSLTVNYQLNGGEVSTLLWTGDLSFKESEVVILDPLEFTPSGNDMIVITGSDPNGNPDEDLQNNSIAKEFGDAFTTNFYKIALALQTDGAPQQTTWQVVNSSEEVLYSAGPFEMPNTLMRDTFELTVSDCYRFIIHDQGCNGLNGGYYLLREAKVGGSLIYSGAVFDCLETTEFQVNWVGMNDLSIGKAPVRVYPNPLRDQTIFYLQMDGPDEVTLSVFNQAGKIVYHNKLGNLSDGEHQIPWSKGQLKDGIYFYQILSGKKQYTGKLILE